MIYNSQFTGAEIDARLAAVTAMQTAISNLETAVAAKYSKPATGIPETDLDASVQAALALARTAVQSLADYYTKAQVDAIADAIGAAVNANTGEVVASLPTPSADTVGKIYYVGPDASGFYDRYVTSYDSGSYSWIPLGNTEIDMAEYAKKEDLDQLEAEVNGGSIESEVDIIGNTEISWKGGYGLKWDTGGTATSSSNSYTINYFPIPSGAARLKYQANGVTGATSNYGICFYDSSQSYMEGVSNVTDQASVGPVDNEVSIPAGAAYVRFDVLTANISTFYAKAVVSTVVEGVVEKLAQKVDKSAIVDSLDSSATDAPLSANQGKHLADIIGGVPISFISGKYVATNYAVGEVVPITFSNYSTWSCSVLDVVPGQDIILNLKIDSTTARAWAFLDAQNRLISKSGADVTAVGLHLTAPANAAKAVFNSTTSQLGPCSTVLLNMQSRLADNGMAVVYVDAVSGLDTNDGSASAPVKTFSRAFAMSGKNVTVIFSGDTSETINLSAVAKREVSIVGKSGTRNRIIAGASISEATEVATDVYSVSRSSFPSANKYYIFQHDVDDAATEILADERHPLQRGLTYRCGCTRLTRVDTYEDVVASATPCYAYVDGTLYFRTVAGTNLAEHPIYLPTSTPAITGNNGSILLKLTNIEVLYAPLNLARCHNAEVTDVAARYAYGDGCFSWDNAIGVKLTRCEAARGFSGSSTGDGFNAHSSTSGDAKAKTTTATLIDCWSHDNNDDGYSDHERCETTIIGGLFEYNSKGGICPSYGAQDTVIGATSRRQQRGICYVEKAQASEGGEGGQVHAKGCLCQNCTWNYSCTNTSATDKENLMVLENCVSYDASSYGFYAGAGARIIAYNCAHGGNGTAKSGNIEVKNVNALT